VSKYVANIDVERLKLRSGDSVLDVGCGAGHLAREFVSRGYSLVGVEPSERLRAEFVATGAELDSAVYSVLDGRAENLPFPDGSWKAIVLTEVLEHVDDPEQVLSELHRVLALDGRLCISVPTSFSERLYSRLHPRYTVNATHLRVFTKDSLTDLLRRCDFRVVCIEGRNFVPAVLWFFHALFRSEADHTGAIRGNLWVSRVVGGFFAVLERLKLLGAVTAIGNRIFAKSWYVYVEKDRARGPAASERTRGSSSESASGQRAGPVGS
jgi:SAM-dependent methyltransferase